jgi:hypothetical protein
MAFSQGRLLENERKRNQRVSAGSMLAEEWRGKKTIFRRGMFQNRPKRLGFTRSRPYHKDDNGHVEQKNWTHVRQLLGYQRLEDPALCGAINTLYGELWEPLHNYFSPCSKLLRKKRHGAKVRRKHDHPMTPCERLLACEEIDAATKERLKRARAALNPFELARRIEEALRGVLHRTLGPTSA